MDNELNAPKMLYQATMNDDAETVRQLLDEYPHLRDDLIVELSHAAAAGLLRMVRFFIESVGMEPSSPKSLDSPEGVVDDAAVAGAFDTTKYLLEKGAKINHMFRGRPYCPALIGAVIEGHSEIVKLLVEHGAELNGITRDATALDFADGRAEMATYLRSKGAKHANELQPAPIAMLSREAEILQHVSAILGQVAPISLQEVVPGDLPLKVHYVKGVHGAAYFTTGMSFKPLKTPPGFERFQHVELVMYLPENPAFHPGIGGEFKSWPLEWLRKVARYPHENNTWLGAPISIITNGDPPQPLGPGTAFTSLIVGVDEKLGELRLRDGEAVRFFSVNGLYTEERDFEMKHGLAKLVSLLDRHRIDEILRPDRVNVACRYK